VKRLALSAFCVVAWTGCSKVTMLRTEELKIVQKDVLAVHTQVEGLQKSVDELNLAQGGSTSKMKADLTLMLTELQSQITRLHSEIDETQYRLTQLSGKIDKLDAKRIIGTPGQPGAPGAAVPAAPGTPAAPGAASPAPGDVRVVEGLDLENLYNQARDDYIRGKYDLALQGFKSVYEKDAGGTWKELALYWIGESLMKQDKPDKAIDAYSRAVKEFPRGSKTCSARFKIGLIYHTKKDTEKRNAEWARLIAECPGSNEAQRAQEMQKE
jgi:TolA-binding protein